MYILSLYRSALKGKIARSSLYLQNELMLYLECLRASVSVKIPFQLEHLLILANGSQFACSGTE